MSSSLTLRGLHANRKRLNGIWFSFFEPKKNLIKAFGKYSCSRKLQIILHNLASFQVLLLVNFYDNDLIELDLPWSCPLSEEVHGGSKTFSFYLYTTLCIQFLVRENNDKNNTLPLGIQICFIIVWSCAEILPFIFLKRITQHYSLHHQQIKNSIVAQVLSNSLGKFITWQGNSLLNCTWGCDAILNKSECAHLHYHRNN